MHSFGWNIKHADADRQRSLRKKCSIAFLLMNSSDYYSKASGSRMWKWTRGCERNKRPEELLFKYLMIRMNHCMTLCMRTWYGLRQPWFCQRFIYWKVTTKSWIFFFYIKDYYFCVTSQHLYLYLVIYCDQHNKYFTWVSGSFFPFWSFYVHSCMHFESWSPWNLMPSNHGLKKIQRLRTPGLICVRRSVPLTPPRGTWVFEWQRDTAGWFWALWFHSPSRRAAPPQSYSLLELRRDNSSK